MLYTGLTTAERPQVTPIILLLAPATSGTKLRSPIPKRTEPVSFKAPAWLTAASLASASNLRVTSLTSFSGAGTAYDGIAA